MIPISIRGLSRSESYFRMKVTNLLMGKVERKNLILSLYGICWLQIVLKVIDMICRFVNSQICYEELKLYRKWYKSYRKVEREHILKSISLLPCYQSNCLDRLEDGGTSECRICDQDMDYSLPIDWDQGNNREQQKRLILLLESLIASHEVIRSKRHRILLVLAIRRIFQHATESAPFDLVSGKIGQWCLKCLHSSSRELRIAAG